MSEERLAIIRTSDRSSFKRCRRRWAWSSSLRSNLTVSDNPSYFWLGTGGHFALEDYYGYNRYGHPVEAVRAYVEACRELKRRTGHGLPDDWQEQSEMLEGVLGYYMLWTESREEYETVWIDGEPQVEVTIHIPIPVEPPPGYDRVVYQLTLDRLVYDPLDRSKVWIKDWKFYKSFSQGDLDYDQQLGAYIWGAQTYYDPLGLCIVGGILHEFKKAIPKQPKLLASGKYSTADNQGTTHRLYRRALIELYGSEQQAPRDNIKCLNMLAMRETEDRDDFIRRTRTLRNRAQIEAEGTKILMEARDMCNPNLPLYPNPTRDCTWDCSFRDICLMVDRDDDWDFALKDSTIERTDSSEDILTWRQLLPDPQ